MSRVFLLGIPIDALSMRQTIQMLLHFLASDRPRHVMTPNNEMLVESTRNPRFRNLLKKSDLNLPDSQGLRLMARWTCQRIPERVTGVDTVQELCRHLDERHTVFLLGARPGVAELASQALRRANPNLVIVGTFSGNPLPEYSLEIIHAINASQPHVLLVAFGSPMQDFWIEEHLGKLPSVRVAIGVGGTFDFIAGVRARAPRFVQLIGFEWLWRFAQQPSRWKRMWNAVVVFPYLVIRHGRRHP